MRLQQRSRSQDAYLTRYRRQKLILAATPVFGLLLVAGTAPMPARQVAMTLTPLAGEAGGVRVSEVLAPSSEPLDLHLDTLSPSLDRVRDTVTGLRVTDADGAVPLTGPTLQNDGQVLAWRASRATHGEVRIAYAIPAALPHPTKRGPHVDVQAIEGGVSGAFKGFLLAPTGRLAMSVHWQLPEGQHAVSSLGDGDVVATGSADELGNTLFLAGPLDRQPVPLPAHGLGIAVLGKGVRLQPAAGWFERTYDAERLAFQASLEAPFRILIRHYDGGPIASGRATSGTFLYYVPPGNDLNSLDDRSTVAHEFVHSLANALDDEVGEEGIWYTEGIADYFMVVLPKRADLYTPTEYLLLVNRMAASYYTNPLRGITNQAIDREMWSGRVAWQVPYTRGFMYLADLDAKLKARRSTMTVLSLVNAMTERFRAGEPKTNATWEALLRSQVGDWAVADFKAMLGGQLIVPPSDAFGPCFARRYVTAGIFDLGFARPVAVHAGEVVGGVDPHGNAARAGLRDGDIIAATVDINPASNEYAAPLTIPVKRAGKLLSIQYDPHRATTTAYVWERSANACAASHGRGL